jgi:hypothetical protein
MTIKAGSCSEIINCTIGSLLAGQLRPRVSETIKRDLKANILYMTDERTALLLVNLDTLGLFKEQEMRILRECIVKASVISLSKVESKLQAKNFLYFCIAVCTDDAHSVFGWMCKVIAPCDISFFNSYCA